MLLMLNSMCVCLIICFHYEMYFYNSLLEGILLLLHFLNRKVASMVFLILPLYLGFCHYFLELGSKNAMFRNLRKN